MLYRPAVFCFVQGLLIGWAAVAYGADSPLVIQSAVSRISQGGKPYDVPLALTGQGSVECRNVAGGLKVVFQFNKAVSSGKVSIPSGKAAIQGKPVFADKTITIQLGNIADMQDVSFSLQNISGTGGAKFNGTVPLRLLEGDVNGDGVVSDADVKQAGSQLGTVGLKNFRADINASGAVRASDVNRITARLGHKLAGAVSNGVAPVINPIRNQKLISGRTPPGIGVVVTDADSTPQAVVVTAISDNPTVVPPQNVVVSGDGSNRILTVTPLAGKAGAANVTVTATDGSASSSQTFTVNVTAAPTAYTANLRPENGITSIASGQASLLLSADELTATVRVDVSNLNGTQTGLQVRGPADAGQSGNVLFDLASAVANMDGSYTWTIVPAGGATAADIVAAIKAGRTYVAAQSTQYTSGELRGQLLLNATFAFTPPAAPPALPTGMPTQNDASRFLLQCTYGPTDKDILLVRAMGYDAWIQQQIDLPPSFTSTSLKTRQGLGEAMNDDQFSESWWGVSLTAPDQLRQRVAFALSQIFVVSQNDGDLSGRPLAVADYYDMLIADAFGNFRQVLEDVSLHPAMGNYLDMRGNRAQYTNTSGQPVIPNENYAREVLQLFSIGLNQLQPDGTLKLDETGNPIPTYDQTTIQGLARVFTGWNYHQAATSTGPGRDDYLPMTPVDPSWHDAAAKTLLDGVTLPAGQNAQKDLAGALNLIFKHANTGPFICKQLIQRLVTDNPSPGYVYRVSKVFADNGQGVRGDLKAVIGAILLDYEARSTAVLSLPGYGKLKEPVLRVSHAIRALHPVSGTGYFKIPNTETDLSQTPLKASTVFNFFEPSYLYPGALSNAGLVAPEFQVTSETTAISYSNFMESGTRTTMRGGDIKLDLSTEQALAGSADTTPLVDRLNTILMSGNMSAGMKQKLVTYLNSLTATDPLTRARAAVHLVTTSPEYCTQK